MPRHKKPYRLYKRPDSGYYQYRLAGWTTWKSAGTMSKTRAEQIAAKALREEAQDPAKGPPLRTFLAPYFVWGKCPHIRRILNDGRSYTERFATDQRKRLEKYVFKDPIADRPVRDLVAGDFEDWKGRMREKGVGDRTINLTRSALNAAINEGVHRGELRWNPLSVVGQVKEHPRERGIFSIAELRRILVDEPGLWGYDPKHRGTSAAQAYVDHKAITYVYLLATTGERPSALFRLRWRDLAGDELTFPAGSTKSGKGRTIPITARNVVNLTRLRDDGLRVADGDLIFCGEDGSAHMITWYRKRFLWMMRNAKLPANDPEGRKRTPYSLKDSFLTHLLDAGADEMLVREYMGHSHGSGASRVLTAVQGRYRKAQVETLKGLLPIIERIYG